jgi:hypothetical protein
MKKLFIILAAILLGSVAFGQTLRPTVNPFTGALQFINIDAGGTYYLTFARDSVVTHTDTIKEYNVNAGILIDGLHIENGAVDVGSWTGTEIADAYVANDITLTNITQITNRSHTNLSDIGTLTHAEIDDTLALHLDSLQAIRLSVNGNAGDIATNATNISSNSIAISAIVEYDSTYIHARVDSLQAGQVTGIPNAEAANLVFYNPATDQLYYSDTTGWQGGSGGGGIMPADTAAMLAAYALNDTTDALRTDHISLAEDVATNTSSIITINTGVIDGLTNTETANLVFYTPGSDQLSYADTTGWQGGSGGVSYDSTYIHARVDSLKAGSMETTYANAEAGHLVFRDPGTGVLYSSDTTGWQGGTGGGGSGLLPGDTIGAAPLYYSQYALDILLGAKLDESDTTAMLSPYLDRTEVRDEISDSIQFWAASGEEGLAIADTAAMLQYYALLSESGGDLSSSDTAAMLSNYTLFSEVILPADTAAMLSSYLEAGDLDLTASDTSAMLGNYTLFSEVILPADTASMLEPYLLESDTAAMLANYVLQSEAGGGIGITDTIEAGTIVPLNSDTIPLTAFVLGSGQAGDTALFQDNAICGAFFHQESDTLVVTSLMCVLAEGSGTETVDVQISWHATFKSGSATNLNTAAYTVTSITTGDEDTSFDNAEIPPNVFVWCTISGTSVDNKPSLLSVTLGGYKRNLSF